MCRQPAALSRLVHVLARSRWISDFITRHPIVIDELLDDDAQHDFPSRGELFDHVAAEALRLSDESLDVQMDGIRHIQKAHQCRIAVAELTDGLPLMRVSDQLTWLAEAILAAVMGLVYARLTAHHGYPHYRLNNEDQMTDGERGIPNTQFYARLAQRVVSFMTTLTPAGILYDIDLRLRPNGSSGVLVTGIEAFERYQKDSAWTWEHQALTRARIVYGPASLCAEFDQVRQRILSIPRDHATLRDDVVAMRERMREHLGSNSSATPVPENAARTIDLKQDAGGLADIEFIAQYLLLAFGSTHPELIEFTDNIRQLEAAAKAGLISTEVAARLSEHYLAFRTLVHREALQGRGKQLIEDQDLATRRHDVQLIWRDVLETNP